MKHMSDEAREARNAYLRAWRRANPDKTQEYRATYWAKKAAERGEAHATSSNDQGGGEGDQGN